MAARVPPSPTAPPLTVTVGPESVPAPPPRFGPGSSGTGTDGFQEALDYLKARGGGLLVVEPGSYRPSRSIVIPSKTSIEFRDCVVQMASGQPVFRTWPGTTDVRLTGRLRADGCGQPNRFIWIVGTDTATIQLDLQAENMGHGFSFLFVKDSQRIEVGGTLASSDSAIVRIVDSSYVTVSGVSCRYVRDPGEVPVRLAGTKPMTNVSVHHVQIDGGGFRTGPMIDLAPDEGAPLAQLIDVHDIVVENPPSTTLFHDGIDISRCTGVTVSNVRGAYVIVVLALLASRGEVSAVSGSHCRAQAVAVGDPTQLTEDIADVVVRDCTAVDCGAGYQGPASAGLAVLVTPGRTVRRVFFQRCQSTDSSGIQPYGFGVSANAFGVVAEDCRFTGKLGAIRNEAGSELDLRRCRLV